MLGFEIHSMGKLGVWWRRLVKMSARAVKILCGRRSRGRGLHIVHSVMESIRRFNFHISGTY